MGQITDKRIDIFYKSIQDEINSRLKGIPEHIKKNIHKISDNNFEQVFKSLNFECEKFPSLDMKNRKILTDKETVPVIMIDDRGTISKDTGKYIDCVRYKIPIIGNKSFFSYACENWNKKEMNAFYAFTLQDNGEKYEYLNLLYERTNNEEVNEFVKNDILKIKSNLEQLKIETEYFNDIVKASISEHIDKHKIVLAEKENGLKKLDDGLDEL